MLNEELKKIVAEENQKDSNPLYICNLLKEYLQIYVLYFIFTSKKYKDNLIFTGGTCLHHFFNLGRLSVDIDFDYIQKIDAENFKNDLLIFFNKKYKYTDIQASLKSKELQILLKFPVLHQLNLAKPNESNLLHVKIDLEPNPSCHYNLMTTSKSKYGFNFAARHFDLPSLMSGKIHAVLKRDRRTAKENRETIKGRDYFDLLWFLKKGTKPNMNRLCDMLKEKITVQEIEKRIDHRVELCTTKFKNDFQSDLIPLIINPAIIHEYIENYAEEYLRNKGNSFVTTIRLEVKCHWCKKTFFSGIQINQDAFENINFVNNIHRCPHCNQDNVVNKKDYITRDP